MLLVPNVSLYCFLFAYKLEVSNFFLEEWEAGGVFQMFYVVNIVVKNIRGIFTLSKDSSKMQQMQASWGLRHP